MKYKIYIYDFETFAHDWIVVFSDLEEKEITVIHNDPAELKRFVCRSNVLFGGFNSKDFDDWIMMTILNGGTPEDVKSCCDWIVKKQQKGRDFPLISGSRKAFVSFDLTDDIAIPISLKAIEANTQEKIIESSISFDLDRALTEDELKETIHYCKWDVHSTVKLFHLRKDYINGKISVGKLKGWDESKCLPCTNPVLTSKFLDAKFHEYDDEFTFEPPEDLQLGKYSFLLDFYKTIDYSKSLEVEIAGITHKFGWGGLHASLENYRDQSTDEWKLVDIDVGSMYPTILLKWLAISRSIPSSEGYADIYHRRLEAKHSGRKEEASALKLVLNSTYGAMKTCIREKDAEGKKTGKILYANPLYDPKMSNRCCEIGQLFLTDLIAHLEAVPSFKLIQSNTDGLMIKYHISDEQKIKEVVDEWQIRSRMTMEYKLIKSIAYMKDVNNYVIVEGETWLFNPDGSKRITDPDKNKITAKGGWVNQWKGGSWMNNSMSIVHKALVEYFVNGVKPEKTINDETDIFKFQIICKTGSTYNGTVWTVDGKDIPVQKVNRVYASKNEKLGLIYKLKGESKTKIADLPDHCLVDNENNCKISDINKQFYIDLAWKRIRDYQGIIEEKPKTTRKKGTKLATVKADDFSKMNVMQKLMRVRKEFLEKGMDKSGTNYALGYSYFELKDIVPNAVDLFNKYGLYYGVAMFGGTAYMKVWNTDNSDEKELEFLFEAPHQTLKKGQSECQAIGGELTYYRRYLWMLCLDIVVADEIDRDSKPNGSDKEDPKHIEDKKPKTDTERKQIVKNLTNLEDRMTEVDRDSIQAGLKKLRDIDDSNETNAWMKEIWKTAKPMEFSKGEAEDILIEIGNRIKMKEGQ